MLINGWLNLYQSGHFHKADKSGTFNRHPGDIYASEELALGDIDHSLLAGYIGTFPFQWEEATIPAVVPMDARPRWNGRFKPVTPAVALQSNSH